VRTSLVTTIIAGSLLASCEPSLAASSSDPASAGAGLLLIGICLLIYFIPTIIAMSRGKATGTGGVFFVNLFFGWTLVGWLGSFIWACTGETNEQIAKRDRQHRELLEVVAAKSNK